MSLESPKLPVVILAGAAIYAAIYPICKTSVLAWNDFGKIGLAETIGVSPRIIVAAV